MFLCEAFFFEGVPPLFFHCLSTMKISIYVNVTDPITVMLRAAAVDAPARLSGREEKRESLRIRMQGEK